MSNKYQQGKIYVVRSPYTHMVYIGSTVLTLERRFSNHKSDHKAGKKNLSSNEVIEAGDAYITLLEAYPCASRKELIMREEVKIKEYLTCNKNRAYVSEAISREERLARSVAWNLANKERVKQYQANYRDCAKCIRQMNAL